MRPAIKRGACLLGTCVLLMISLPIVASAQTGPGSAAIAPCVALVKATGTIPTAQPVSLQAHHDARTDASFFFSSTRDGAVRMMMKSADLELEKTVYPDGRFQIVVQIGDDHTSVVGAPGTLEVERRNRGREHLDVARAGDDEWLRTKVLLAGSKAIRRFRTLAYNLDARTLQTPAGAAVLMSDAILGLLDGDVGAIRRLGQQIRAARQAQTRPVALGQEFLNCYRKYAEAVTAALDEWLQCSSQYWMYDPRQWLCELDWLLKAESAWFQFFGCSAIPLRIE
jgi:hypothetical protein